MCQVVSPSCDKEFKVVGKKTVCAYLNDVALCNKIALKSNQGEWFCFPDADADGSSKEKLLCFPPCECRICKEPAALRIPSHSANDTNCSLINRPGKHFCQLLFDHSSKIVHGLAVVFSLLCPDALGRHPNFSSVSRYRSSPLLICSYVFPATLCELFHTLVAEWILVSWR